MTAGRNDPDNGTAVSAATTGAPVTISRRRLIGGAAVTLPTILTLRSGTLAAASFSGTITPSRYAPLDSQNRALCIDPTSTQGYAGKSGGLKLGDPPMAQVNAIPTDRAYHVQADGTSATVTPTEVCYQDTTYAPYYYQLEDGTFQEALLPRGGMVSATALASVVNAGGIIEISEI